MKARWWIGALLVAIAAVLAWPRLPDPATATAPATTTSALPAPPAPQAIDEPAPAGATPPVAAAERREAALERGALRGRVVTSERTPIAGATVTIVDGPMPPATTGPDGTFVLPIVAPGRHSLLASAPGHAAAQQSDVSTTASEVVDVGDLVLPTAATYRGRVRSRGQGLGDAEITFRPELNARRGATPIVQRVRTDADGWFYCDAASTPPILVRATAPAHRAEPARRVTTDAAELLFDLVPLPVVRGRVVDGTTNAAMPQAHVQLMEMGDGPLPGMGVQVPAFTPNAATAVGADGAFLRTVTSTNYALAAIAEGYSGCLVAPCAFVEGASHTIVMTRGASVLCNATWQVRGLGGHALLLASDAPGAQPHVQWPIATGEPTRLPPVPCGRWLLRIEAEGPALHEQWLDLRTPEEHRVDVVLQDGARLVGRYLDIASAGREVVCSHVGGRVLRGAILGDGTFAVPGLHPGDWAIAVLDRYSDAATHRATDLMLALREIRIDVRRDTREVRLDLQPADQHFGSVHIQAPTLLPGTTFELVAGDDRQRLVPWPSRTATLGKDGRCTIAPALPGTWQLRATPPGQTATSRTIVVTAGAATEVHLPD